MPEEVTVAFLDTGNKTARAQVAVMLWTAESLVFTQRALVTFFPPCTKTQRKGKGAEEKATYNI